MPKLSKFIKQNYLAIIIIAFVTAAYLVYEIMSYQKFRFTMLDLGLYNRHMWSLIRFDFSANPLKGFNLMGDHAHLILWLLAPFYLFFQSPYFLLFVQVIFISLSGFPIYLIACKYFKNRNIAALWLIPYFLFFGFASALAFPFHVEPLAVLPLSFALYFLLEKKYTGLFISLALLAIVKENMPLVVAAFGLYLMIFHRRLWQGFLVIAISGIYLYLSTHHLLPYFSHVPYGYVESNLGGSMAQIAVNGFKHPIELVKDFFLPSIKSHTLFYEFASFGFIGILAPEMLILLLPLWLGRFISSEVWRWTTMQHYSASQGPILAVAAIIGGYRISKWLKSKIMPDIITPTIFLIALAGSIVSYVSIDRKPLSELFNVSLYRHSLAEIEASKAVKSIPQKASVATQAAFPQLSGRREIYVVSDVFPEIRPDYILLSTEFDYWPFNSREELDNFVDEAKIEYHYEEVLDQNGIILLHKSG